MRSQIGPARRGISLVFVFGIALSFQTIAAKAEWSNGAECRYGRFVMNADGETHRCVCPDASQPRLDTSQGTFSFICPTPSPAGSLKQAQPHSTKQGQSAGKAAEIDPATLAAAQERLLAAMQEHLRILSMIQKGNDAVDVAIDALEEATAKSEELQTLIDKTDDPQEKLALLNERLALSRSMLNAAKQRDQLRETVRGLHEDLSVARDNMMSAQAEWAALQGHSVEQSSSASVELPSPNNSHGKSSVSLQPIPINKDVPVAGQLAQTTTGQLPHGQQKTSHASNVESSTPGPKQKTDMDNVDSSSPISGSIYSGNFAHLNQAYVNDHLGPYGGDNQHFRKVADHAPYARLAAAVYGKSEPEGWLRIFKYQDQETGLEFAAFEGPSNEVVVAFAGTQDVNDWANNALLAGVSIDNIPQFALARDLSKQILAHRKSVTFVGHSLGGGLAHYVAAEYGQRAVAFNPAPTKASIAAAGRFDLLDYNNIVNFRSPNDPLTGLTEVIALGPTSIQVNNQPTYSAHNPYLINPNHSMENLSWAMTAAEMVKIHLDGKQ